MLLSKREEEVLNLIIQENSSSGIAQKLQISVRTVDTHRKNISSKLETKSLIGLTKFAIREGMLEGYSFGKKNT